MPVYRVELSEPAENDVRDIIVYVAAKLSAPNTAIKMADAFDDAWLRLGRNPNLYALINDDVLAAQGFRKIAIKNYLAFFTIDESAKVVDVHRVLYNRQDWARLLQ